MILLFCLASAVLYRMGGSAKFNTRYRDAGVPAIFVLALITFGGLSWPKGIALFFTYPLMWAALSTYRYFLPKPKDYLWYHYALHGAMVALAAFPYAWATGHWLALVVRAAACTVLLGLWSFVSIDWLEEGGRGFFILSTAIMLL